VYTAAKSRHPVTLISISDYHTRSQANDAKGDSMSLDPCKAKTLVAGALLGTQTGREVIVEIVFELAFTNEGTLDELFLTSRLDQCPDPLSILRAVHADG